MIERPEDRAEMQSGKTRSSCPDLTPLLAIQRQRDGRMENKVADGVIGMRPSAILRRPSIFKSSSLAKRAGGRRVFLSRRKITHYPLSAVPRPSPTSCLLFAAVASLVRFSWSTTASRNLSLSPFSGPRYIFFRSPWYHWWTGENIDSKEICLWKKKAARREILFIYQLAKLSRSRYIL